MKNQITKEEKQKYFDSLRKKWKEARDSFDTLDQKTKDSFIAKWTGEQIQGMSHYGLWFAQMSMQEAGFDGYAGIDVKTFNKWKEEGFTVKKGEKSKISGISWIKAKTKDEDDANTFMYPKEYHLFHRSQVE